MGRQLVSLTGIRGVAAIWVVLFHAYPFFGPLLGGPDRAQVPVIREGYLGVDLFFILSGFVLSLAYSERFKANFHSAVTEFFFARVLRIYPLHWFCLAIFVLLFESFPENRWGPGPFTLNALVAAAALVQNWRSATALAWNHPTWSLSAECAAYLLFPVLTLVISLVRDRRLAFGLALVSLVALTASLLAWGSKSLDHVGPGGIVRCLFEFTAGALAWKALPAEVWQAGSAETRRLGELGEICLVLGASLLLLALAVPPAQMAAPFAFMMLIMACALPSQTAERLFGNRVVIFLGNISFSIYLVHIFLLGCLILAIDRNHVNTDDWPARFGASMVFLPLVLVTAYLSWRFVERPTHEFARRHGKVFTSRILESFGLLRSPLDSRLLNPATLPLWVMRVVAMSLGVTAGDFLSTTLQLGFGPSTFILVMVFFGLLAAQIIARRSSQMLSWSLVVCSTTAGTTMSDFLYSCVGSGGSLLLLMIAPSIGRFAVGPASADHNIAPRIQIFYWTTFLFLSAFGTNMGDFLVRDVGLGYAGGGLILCCAITLVVLAYCFTNLSPTRLFWVAFVLTRSLGMIVADTLTRTHAEGGLDVGTAGASVILAAVLTLLILLAGRGPEELNGWALISGAKNAAR